MAAVMPPSQWVTILLLVAYTAAASSSSSSPPGRFGGLHRIAATKSHPSTSINPSSSSSIHHQLHQFRGGAISDDEYDDYDSEYDEESDDDEEPIVATAKKLATSTKTAVQKKKAAAIKSKVKVAMASSSTTKSVTVPKKSSQGSLYKRYVPYIIRACLNPFTLLAMTKAYFVSLCDINYLKEEQSQTLRSALEEKARQQPSSGPTKPKRKMKPGQAKTLSDLPQLSA